MFGFDFDLYREQQQWSNSRVKILLWISFKLGLLILTLIVSSSEFYGKILCKASDSISKEGIFPFFFYLRHTPHSTIISFFPFKAENEIKNTVKTIVNVFSQKKRRSLKRVIWTKVLVSCVCLFNELHCSKLEHFSQDNTIEIKDFIVTERR